MHLLRFSLRRPFKGWARLPGSNSTLKIGLGWEPLYKETTSTLQKGNQTPGLIGVFSSFDINVPQIDSHVDREKAKTYGIPLSDVFDTLQVYLGSLYVNDFNRFGRTYQVNVQA